MPCTGKSASFGLSRGSQYPHARQGRRRRCIKATTEAPSDSWSIAYAECCGHRKAPGLADGGHNKAAKEHTSYASGVGNKRKRRDEETNRPPPNESRLLA